MSYLRELFKYLRELLQKNVPANLVNSYDKDFDDFL